LVSYSLSFILNCILTGNGGLGLKGSEQMVDQSQSKKSHEDLEGNMDEDVEEEMDRKLNEDDLRGMLKVNLNKCIEDMQIKPK
jgi:hypothetical protein